MSNAVKTGVYFCKYLNGHPDSIQLNELYAFAEGMEEVAHIWKTGDLDLLNHQNLASVISAQGITRIVLVGEKPGFIQPMFSKALAHAGLDPTQIANVSFTEYDATRQKDTDLARLYLPARYWMFPSNLQPSLMRWMSILTPSS